MASRQTYLGYAHAAAQTLTSKWFPTDGPTTWVNDSDFWRAPNAMTSLTDLMQLDGTRSYMATAANAKSVFMPNFTPPSLPSYYDDECWWGACFLRLGALTGDASWIGIADQIFADLKGGWDDVAGGGVWWMRDPKSYPDNQKGSIENELYMDIAMTLYAAKPAPERQAYLDAAKQTWHWMQAFVICPNGLVWGSLNQDGTRDGKNVARPYNQGTVLGPLWAMYEAERDTAYLDSAQKIIAAAFDTMTWPDGILREICEQRGNCGPDDTNPALFKGVFVRYLGEFARRLATSNDPAHRQAAQQYAAFLQHNADTVWANFPCGIFGMDWHTRQPDYQPTKVLLYDGPLQSSALDLFVAAALVSD